jgi:hypothetical protein
MKFAFLVSSIFTGLGKISAFPLSPFLRFPALFFCAAVFGRVKNKIPDKGNRCTRDAGK